MQLDKIFPTAGVAIVAAAVTELAKYLHIKYLVHPDWAGSVDGFAIVLALILSMVLFIVLHDAPKKTLSITFGVLAAITIALLLLCFSYFLTLDTTSLHQDAERQIRNWHFTYIVTVQTFVGTAVVFQMWLSK